jgi:hypothetical protein
MEEILKKVAAYLAAALIPLLVIGAIAALVFIARAN